ncbi:MAG: SlyX family protein [Chromatiales bacterium]|nr:SlyX family protein [Gammaproteobacteria bacterium]MBW6476403.1 SlyX family protein [Chromatiales bacterium]
MESRLDDLEFRLTHQELAIDNLTESNLQQQQAITRLQAEIAYLKTLLRELTPSAVAAPGEETPPPHY